MTDDNLLAQNEFVRNDYSENELDNSNEDQAENNELDQEILNNYRQNPDQNINDFRNNQPLYRGAPVTVGSSMLMNLALAMNHNLNQSCISDIIECINLHCIKTDLKKNSLYKFNKYFNLSDSKYYKHYYCSECTHMLESETSKCPSCQDNNEVSYFTEMPFLEQLQTLYKRNGFYNSLQDGFDNRQNLSDSINDLYDGHLYQTFIQNGFLSNRNNISLSWYTDGVPVFKSSKVSMWPLCFSINELPFKERVKRENILLAGMWFGNKKPDANQFLHKFRSQLKKLARGFEVTLPNQHIINVRGVVLYGTCDLVAKCQFFNFTQFNGNFGCPHCLNPGKTESLSSGGNTHVYEYLSNSILRTTEESINHANIALQNGAPYFGVKGPSVISKIMPDFINGTGIDRMHGIDGGVVKKLLTLWFIPKFKNFPFSLFHVKDVINKMLTSVKPPKFIHRFPRTIDDLLHWKSSELQMWMFHYSMPILFGVMQTCYFNHYMFLVTAVSILNSDSVDKNIIDTAKFFLHKFVKDFEIKYGLEFCTINIHQLLHVAECVKNIGPLWSFTCYPYENLNGLLLQLIHGTTHIDSQVTRSHGNYITMTNKLEYLPEGEIKDFCLQRKKQVKVREQIFLNCYTVGAYYDAEELPADVQDLLLSFNILLQNTKIYLRLKKNGKLYISKSYEKDLKTRSCYVLFTLNNTHHFGKIHYFIKTTAIDVCQCLNNDCQCVPQHYAIIQRLHSHRAFKIVGKNHDVYLPHIYNCEFTNERIVTSIENLLNVCIYMNVNNQKYISCPVNSKELE